MKIGLISHKSYEGYERFFEKMQRAIDFPDLDILIGPEYSLASASNYEFIPSSAQVRQKILKQIKSFSKRSPKTLILPGTMPLIEGDKMYLSCPGYKGGRANYEFFKGTDNGEGRMARKNNLVYTSGDTTKNRFNLKEKNIAYEICGDHGKQELGNCDLEIIASLDDRGGFYINTVNDTWAHHGLVCNGFDGSCFGQFYNPEGVDRIKEIQPVRFQDLYVFDIDSKK